VFEMPGNYKLKPAEDAVADASALEEASDLEEAEAGAEGEGENEAKPGLEDLVTESERVELPSASVLEAALFLANKQVTIASLSEIVGVSKNECVRLVEELRTRYETNGNAFEIVVNGDVVSLQVRGKFLSRVSRLSKQIDLTRKATRILALIAKKKQLLQKELPKYFRGEIYAYVHELKEAGYLDAQKHGNTRLLKPTQKFYDNFQLSE
jgi:chromosome segregation and condensation protein ScpB